MKRPVISPFESERDRGKNATGLYVRLSPRLWERERYIEQRAPRFSANCSVYRLILYFAPLAVAIQTLIFTSRRIVVAPAHK
ncbi:MAG: hypothetical protein R3B70_20690 [Polyangiaceae bacterium]